MLYAVQEFMFSVVYIIIFKNQEAYLDNKYFGYQMIIININMMCIFEML